MRDRKSLPPSYVQFVTTFSNGAYLYLMQEVSAVGEGNKQIAAIQNITWLEGAPSEQLLFRDSAETTTLGALVPFGLDENANAWCFLTDTDTMTSECPVGYFDTTGRKIYGRLESFASWLAILIENQNHVVRCVCDPDVIDDELHLG